MGLFDFFIPKNKDDVIRLLRLVSNINSTTKEAAEATEKIIGDISNWKEGLLQWANERGYKMQDVVSLFQQNKEYVSKYVPEPLLKEAVNTIDELTAKQNSGSNQRMDSRESFTRENTTFNPRRQDKPTSATTRGKYKIIPLS